MKMPQSKTYYTVTQSDILTSSLDRAILEAKQVQRKFDPQTNLITVTAHTMSGASHTVQRVWPDPVGELYAI
jgi:hypothetical protein